MAAPVSEAKEERPKTMAEEIVDPGKNGNVVDIKTVE